MSTSGARKKGYQLHISAFWTAATSALCTAVTSAHSSHCHPQCSFGKNGGENGCFDKMGSVAFETAHCKQSLQCSKTPQKRHY